MPKCFKCQFSVMAWIKRNIDKELIGDNVWVDPLWDFYLCKYHAEQLNSERVADNQRGIKQLPIAKKEVS